MTRLTPLSYREVEKRLRALGYLPVRQVGSHVRFAHSANSAITVPHHKVIGRGLLRKIIRDLAISVEDFLNA